MSAHSRPGPNATICSSGSRKRSLVCARSWRARSVTGIGGSARVNASASNSTPHGGPGWAAGSAPRCQLWPPSATSDSLARGRDLRRAAPGGVPGLWGRAARGARVASQYQEDLPVVRPIVRRFDVEVGCCVACGRRVQGRHPLQTSDALGAANVHLGPGAVTLVVLLHKHVGVSLEKIAACVTASVSGSRRAASSRPCIARRAWPPRRTQTCVPRSAGVPSSVPMRPAGASAPCCTGCGVHDPQDHRVCDSSRAQL